MLVNVSLHTVGYGEIVHLRVKKARFRLEDLNGAIEGLLRVEGVTLGDNSRQVQPKLLRVQVRLEDIW